MYLSVERGRQRRQPVRQSPQQIGADGRVVRRGQWHGAEARAQRGGEAVQVVRVLTLLRKVEAAAKAKTKWERQRSRESMRIKENQ